MRVIIAILMVVCIIGAAFNILFGYILEAVLFMIVFVVLKKVLIGE
jgi:hypothetical protein